MLSVGQLTITTPDTFVAHGWEPLTATQSFLNFQDPNFMRALSHLRGQSVRFGGISADFLHYVVDSNPSPACLWRDFNPRFKHRCEFSTGSFDYLVDSLQSAGLRLLFDLDELEGRNCTQPALKPWQPPQWCGDPAAPWDTAPLRGLLEHVRDVSPGITTADAWAGQRSTPISTVIETHRSQASSSEMLLSMADVGPP